MLAIAVMVLLPLGEIVARLLRHRHPRRGAVHAAPDAVGGVPRRRDRGARGQAAGARHRPPAAGRARSARRPRPSPAPRAPRCRYCWRAPASRWCSTSATAATWSRPACRPGWRSCAIPVALAIIALRLVWHASPRWWARGIAALGLARRRSCSASSRSCSTAGRRGRASCCCSPPPCSAAPSSPCSAASRGAALHGRRRADRRGAGRDLSAGGVAAARRGAAVHPDRLPARRGKSSQRLLAVFRALFGWIPGGTAVVCALVCAFFTIFTGGSGVTILALGGLMFPALARRALPGALLARPAHRVGVARPALAAGAAADPLRHRRPRADRGPLHRRPPARAC